MIFTLPKMQHNPTTAEKLERDMRGLKWKFSSIWKQRTGMNGG